MRKTHLIMLPDAKSLSRLFCLLFYLSYPNIALGREQPDIGNDLYYSQKNCDMYGNKASFDQEEMCYTTGSQTNCEESKDSNYCIKNNLMCSNMYQPNIFGKIPLNNSCKINSNASTNTFQKIINPSETINKARRVDVRNDFANNDFMHQSQVRDFKYRILSRMADRTLDYDVRERITRNENVRSESTRKLNNRERRNANERFFHNRVMSYDRSQTSAHNRYYVTGNARERNQIQAERLNYDRFYSNRVDIAREMNKMRITGARSLKKFGDENERIFRRNSVDYSENKNVITRSIREENNRRRIDNANRRTALFMEERLTNGYPTSSRLTHEQNDRITLRREVRRIVPDDINNGRKQNEHRIREHAIHQRDSKRFTSEVRVNRISLDSRRNKEDKYRMPHQREERRLRITNTMRENNDRMRRNHREGRRTDAFVINRFDRGNDIDRRENRRLDEERNRVDNYDDLKLTRRHSEVESRQKLSRESTRQENNRRIARYSTYPMVTRDEDVQNAMHFQSEPRISRRFSRSTHREKDEIAVFNTVGVHNRYDQSRNTVRREIFERERSTLELRNRNLIDTIRLNNRRSLPNQSRINRNIEQTFRAHRSADNRELRRNSLNHLRIVRSSNSHEQMLHTTERSTDHILPDDHREERIRFQQTYRRQLLDQQHTLGEHRFARSLSLSTNDVHSRTFDRTDRYSTRQRVNENRILARQNSPLGHVSSRRQDSESVINKMFTAKQDVTQNLRNTEKISFNTDANRQILDSNGNVRRDNTMPRISVFREVVHSEDNRNIRLNGFVNILTSEYDLTESYRTKPNNYDRVTPSYRERYFRTSVQQPTFKSLRIGISKERHARKNDRKIEQTTNLRTTYRQDDTRITSDRENYMRRELPGNFAQIKNDARQIRFDTNPIIANFVTVERINGKLNRRNMPTFAGMYNSKAIRKEAESEEQRRTHTHRSSNRKNYNNGKERTMHAYNSSRLENNRNLLGALFSYEYMLQGKVERSLDLDNDSTSATEASFKDTLVNHIKSASQYFNAFTTKWVMKEEAKVAVAGSIAFIMLTTSVKLV